MRASITAPLHSAQRGAQIFQRSHERMMRPMKELPSNTLLLDAQAPSLDAGWDLALADLPALPRFLPPNRLAAGPSTCSS